MSIETIRPFGNVRRVYFGRSLTGSYHEEFDVRLCLVKEIKEG